MKITARSIVLGSLILAGLLLAGCADPTDGKPDAKVADPIEIPAEPTAATAPAEGAIVDQFSQPSEGSRPKTVGDTYALTPSTTIGFVGSKVTGSHAGGFRTFDGSVTIPGTELDKATIKANIDTTSLFVDNNKLAGHLMSADFFDVAKFPKAAFTSTSIAKTAAGFDITGNFELHGITKSITFPATMTLADGTLTANAEFSIKRFDFGIVYPGKVDDLIRDEVLIKLNVEAKKAA